MSVTLHTTAGDLKLELYCQECPKTCENFLALCASDYYKDNVFHRNIKDFMVQTGDPTGTGKGGNSIWGVPFADELNPDLKHDARGVISMANNGPNTNKSQFFITYDKQPSLDLKYTVFGRVIDGFDSLEELETIKVDAKYRPVVEQSLETIDDIVSLLNAQRAKDIVVLSNLSSHISSLVICSPFNSRHGSAIAETLRRATKENNYQVTSRIALQRNSGWFIVNIGSIQVNVMSEEVRNRYDLEGLWGAGVEEPEPEFPLIPPSRS